MSQPADEVTGSQEVGSAHSQLMVPLAPAAAAAAEPDPVADGLAELPQAARAEIAAMEAAAAAPRQVRRALGRGCGPRRRTGTRKRRNHRHSTHTIAGVGRT